MSNPPRSQSGQKAEVIQVPNTLKMKVGPKFGGIDPEAVARAEAALKDLSSQFADWLHDEVTRLENARAEVKTHGLTDATAEVLYVCAHDLKGLGTTYEFPLVTRIAGSLCKMMDEQATRAQASTGLIDAHVDAIRAAVRDNIRAADHPVGNIIASELEGRVTTFLAERRR